MYADKTATGIIAFFIVSAASGLAAAAWITDNKVPAFFFAAAATCFYGGSIVGGYMSAKKYNAALSDEMRRRLSRDFKLQDDRVRLYNMYGVPALK